jgi:Creatinine amidohydrolase
MRRLATLIVIGCLLLGGCDRRCVGPECTSLDYLDFLRFGGITYYAGDSNLVGRKPRPSDLGPVFGVVRRNPPNDDLNYQMRDGDAAFVAPGAPVYTVKGYRPAFRLAAGRHPLRFYEAGEVPGARSGADVLDLAGKVRYIGINSGFAGTVSLSASTLVAVVTDVAESLHTSGIDRLAVVNGHGGNYVLANVVQQANIAGPRMTLFPSRTDWDVARTAAGLDSTASEDMHAGELEVSLLLHAYPELVGGGYRAADHRADPRPHLLVTGMRSYTETGVIGRPSLASADKGRTILHSLARSF